MGYISNPKWEFWGEVLILYSHADGFKLRVDKRMIILVEKWIEAVLINAAEPETEGVDLMQWLQYATRNTTIWNILPKKMQSKIKKMIKKQCRAGCAKWLQQHIVKNKSAKMRKEEVEGHLRVRCSNPQCDVTELGESQLMKCNRCWFTRYCSRKCQKAHYADHKVFCKEIA